MHSSTLRERTLTLVKQRPRSMTYRNIADATGLEIKWLEAFGQGRIENPGVCNVETLYVYLSGKPLDLEA